jgi:hypothetical protein
MHDDVARGSTYITVDHPAVIATYLQLVIPRYTGTSTTDVSDADSLPPEILAYLEQNQRFCQWYVEVAWQRLPQRLKTPQLQRHWKRFGNLEKPMYKKILIPDAYDDWRGIGQVHLRRDDLVREWTVARKHLSQANFGELYIWLGNLSKRTSLINRRW